MVDVALESFVMADTLTPGRSVAIHHTLRLQVGSTSSPIDQGDFTSAIYLSRDDIYDPLLDYHYVEVNNLACKLLHIEHEIEWKLMPTYV